MLDGILLGGRVRGFRTVYHSHKTPGGGERAGSAEGPPADGHGAHGLTGQWRPEPQTGDPSVVAELREEVAAALRTHVEQSPDRIDEIAGSVVLAGFLLHVEQLAVPEVTDCAVGILTEYVVHRFVPVFAGLVPARG